MLALDDGPATNEEHRGTSALHLRLLGGFRAERLDLDRSVSDWKRQSAKTLTKLLAAHPQHALHREQLLEILWPGLDLESALNSFGKALHAARRALEPELIPRSSSRFLHLSDSMLSLDPEWVVIDTDRFQHLADNALRRKEISAYESALHAYGGELLPEDRYEDWCAERRDLMAELHVRLLVGLAEALEVAGVYSESADRLREALERDPAREEAHRRLMRVYAETGNRNLALRQFHLCQEILRRELGLTPQQQTLSLYEDLLQDRLPQGVAAENGDRAQATAPRPAVPTASKPFAGRNEALAHLHKQLVPSNPERTGVILVAGEAGVGKTRLVEEFAHQAERAGVVVISAGSGQQANHFACGPFPLALENYVAGRPEAEREEIALRYPALARCLPSLPINGQDAAAVDLHQDLLPAMVRLLTHLGQRSSVLLVLGDVEDLDRFSCDLLRYLAHLASTRPWLIIGVLRDDPGPELQRAVDPMAHDRLCSVLELECLARADCDELARTLLADPSPTCELLDQIWTGSRGNPLFIEELVDQARGPSELVGRDCRRAPAGASRVPTRVDALLTRRLGAADENLRRLLALAAVTNATEVPLEELRAGAAALDPPIPDSTFFDALDGVLHMRLLEERGDAYAFRHPLLRSALYEGLPRHRRAELRAALDRPRSASSRRLRAAATT